MDERRQEAQGHEQGQRISPFASYSGEPLFPPSFRSGQSIAAEAFQKDYPERFRIWESTRKPLGEASMDDVSKSKARRGWLQLANNLDRYATAHHAGEKQTLRARQMDVFDDIHAAVERGEKEGYIEAPTGFGKTVLFGEVVAATDVPTVIVVPRKRLVEQTYESIKKFNPDVSVGRVYGDRKEHGEQVLITTYQSLTTDTEGDRIPTDDAALVILDEVDEATGVERMKAIDRFPEALLLGFSATPVKVEGEEHADKRVAKMMQNEIHNISLREGVEEGYLSSFSSYVVQVDTDLSNVRVTEAGNFNEEELEQAINTKAQNEAAVKFFLELEERDSREQHEAGKTPEPLTTAVYASSVRHAQDLAREFEEAGVTAAAVWGGQNAKEQEEIMQKWADGEIEVVCSKDLLVRGNDIPKIRLIENVAPTASYAVEKQRCGRGLRLDPNNPDKHTVIADFVYPNANRRGQQVTFAEIADGAEIYRNPTQKEQEEQQKADGDIFAKEISADEFQVEGLKVTTNPNEVMRIVKEISSQREDVSELSEDEYSITIRTLNERFIGDAHNLLPIANEILQEFQEEHPELVARRRNVRKIVTIVTDPELFEQKMLERGVELRDKSIQEIQEGDFVIVKDALSDHFMGESKRVFSIAKEVIRDLEEEHPELVEHRKSGKHTVAVVTDPELFEQKMLERGIKSRDKSIQELQGTDFAITRKTLRECFVGNSTRLASIADEVRIQLEKEHPELLAQRKKGKATVPVVTDRDFFIQEMQKRGIQLQDKSIENLQESDFAVTDHTLRELFMGSSKTLASIADEVFEKIKEEHPEQLVLRKSGTRIAKVVTDPELFIQMMLEHGAQLHDRSIEKLKDTDFAITGSSITESFVGGYYKNNPIANDVRKEIEEEHPELLAQRKKGKATVPVVTDREMFIQKMVERGAKLRER